MKSRKILALTLCFVFALSTLASATTLEFKMGNLFMNESADEFNMYLLETAPYTKNGRTMVPVRIISERFGASVGWNGDTNEVSIVKDDKNIVLTLGSDIAIVNGENVKIDAAPEELNGRTMVPIRFISETLGKSARYIASTEQVVITDDEPLLTINGVDINIEHYKTLMLALGYEAGNLDAIEYVGQITPLIKEVYGAGTAIAKEGKYQPGTDAAQIDEALNNVNTYMREAKVLSYPMAEYWDYETLIYDKAEEYQGAYAQEDVDKLYEEMFVTAKHILILIDDDTTEAQAKKKAEEVLTKLKRGEDFDKLIAQYNEDPGVEQNPDGYTFTKGEMVLEFENAAFELSVGEISGLVKTSYGYHILKREPLAPITDEIKDNIIYYLEERAPYLIVAEEMEKAQITVHKTDEEIAAMIIK